MSEGKAMTLAKARALAEKIAAELAPGCARCEIAGSVRRQCPQVHDLEIVCIPRFQEDLFGGAAGSYLDPILERLVIAGRLERIKGGSKYKQYLVPGAKVCLDLFLVTPETWAIQYLIRTGSHQFSKQAVQTRDALTPDGRPGLLPPGWHVAEGLLWKDDGELVPLVEEQDFFAAIGLEFVPPESRA